MITATSNEMELTITIESPQTFWHGKNIVQASISPALRVIKTVSAKNGAPDCIGRLRVDGERWATRPAYFFKNSEDDISATRRLQKLLAMIATTGNEMEFTATMESLQAFGHGKNIVQASVSPALCATKPWRKERSTRLHRSG